MARRTNYLGLSQRFVKMMLSGGDRPKEFGRSIAALARPCANTRSKPERTGKCKN